MSIAHAARPEYLWFNNVLDEQACEKIRKLAQGEWVKSGVTAEEHKLGDMIHYGHVDEKYRISDTCWISEQWLFELIWNQMEEANKLSGWKLDISAVEEVQLTRYKKGGHYKWHRDGNQDSWSAYDRPGDSHLDGKVRKISFSLILNDDFEGGDFEFCSYEAGESMITPIKAKRGDMIFFPSGMEHRVRPVTKGTRYSLVGWFVGPPIK